jgi:hypothetical protein
MAGTKDNLMAFKNVKLIHGLTPEQWNELEKFIANQVKDQGVTRLQIGGAMYTFGNNFSLPAMYRFLQFAKAHRLTKLETGATLMHDLNGRNQNPAIFSPRTSSY